MATIDRYLDRLNRAQTQEEVDQVVKSARKSNLSEEKFQSFCRQVLNRRAQLPEREP